MHDNFHLCMAGYLNLAAAIVAQAIRDVVDWEVEKRTQKCPLKSSEMYKDACLARKFLHDEGRLIMFTKFTSEDIDAIIERKVENIMNNINTHSRINAM